MAAGAILGFAAAMPTGLLLWPHRLGDWALAWGMFTVLFGLVLLAAGWLVQQVDRRGWLSRT